jgi:hypothetical protein
MLRRLAVAVLLIVVASITLAQASDATAVYARIDRVVLEPKPAAPDTIQIWGVFSIAKPNDRNDYLMPARGYLYFAASGNKETARKEWADLKSIAGTGQIVAFGSRSRVQPRLRGRERPTNPDPYVIGFGLTRVRGNTEYAPVRALLDYRD